MLEDRDYMRADPAANPWFNRLPAALWLVILNVLFYAAQLIVPLAGGSFGQPAPRLESYLALYPGDVLKGWVWQLLTFQLLHGSPLHLILNCAMLYIFGRPVESALGRSRFLKFYFGSGAFGGVVQVAFAWLFREHFGYREGFGWPPVVGASAGVFGLIAAFAMLHRNTPVTMLVAFIIPVSMKAKYLLLVEAILTLLGLLDARSGIAHAAHLGGMLAGVAYIRWGNTLRDRLGRWRPRQTLARKRELVRAVSVRDRPWRHGSEESSPDLPSEEFISQEVDPILDKISAHGIQSLTERERRILEAARKKMARS